MNPRKLKPVWVFSLTLIVTASYKWPTFGVAFLGSAVVLLGVANNLLSIQSKMLGLFTGGSASALALATGMGAGMNAWQLILGTVIAAIVGYGFAALPVGSIDATQECNSDDCPSKFNGSGGDFGGGGASGKY